MKENQTVKVAQGQEEVPLEEKVVYVITEHSHEEDGKMVYEPTIEKITIADRRAVAAQWRKEAEGKAQAADTYDTETDALVIELTRP